MNSLVRSFKKRVGVMQFAHLCCQKFLRLNNTSEKPSTNRRRIERSDRRSSLLLAGEPTVTTVIS